jgi:hypothetical protein
LPRRRHFLVLNDINECIPQPVQPAGSTDP